MQNKSYYAVIPADVRYSDIPQGAKLLYGEITALCNEKGFCWASNQYFADLYKKDERTIQRWLDALEKRAFIEKKLFFNANTNTTERHLIIWGDKNVTHPMTKMSGGGDKNVTHNNTDNNTSLIKDIVEYLNNTLGTKYRATSDKTKKHINARLNEGYTFEDFKAVIDKKSEEWRDDSKMAQYLRPETLFGTKFESYLNQKVVKPKNGIEINQKQREGMVDVIDWGM